MKKSVLLPLVALVIILAGIVFLYFRIQSSENPQTNSQNTQQNNQAAVQDCIPTFADGGGPYYQPNSPSRENLAPDTATGSALIVSGKVLQNDCKTPVANAVVDIWQANESGSYEDEWYRGQIRTDDDGNYKFQTVMPSGYGSGTGFRPPHIHFKVFVNGAAIITSQMFFPEVIGRRGFDEAYVMEVEERQEDGETITYGTHNIILP